MSNFDIAVGVNAGTLNNGAAKLYADPTARNKIFKGSYSKDVAGKGTVTLTYDLLQAPVFTLTPPTQDQWKAAIKAPGVTDIPAANGFQVSMPKVSGSVAIDGGTPTQAQGPLLVYATASVTNGKITLTPVAVYINEADFSQFDAWLVNNILAPAALQMAGTILNGYQLPSIPTYRGVTLNAPSAGIMNNMVVAAVTATTNTNPLDMSGFAWPQKNFFVLLNPSFINNVLKTELQPYQNKNYSGSESAGNDFAWAKGSYSATIKTLVVTVNPSNPATLNASVTADVSVTGSAGGIGPALACPVGAALNAL